MSLFTVGFLAGCNQTGDAEGYTDEDDVFKTFNFVKEYDDDEKNSLIYSVTNNMKSLSTITSVIDRLTDTDNKKETQKKNNLDTVYSDSRYPNNVITKSVSDVTATTTENGITFKEEYHEDYYGWDATTNVEAAKRKIAMKDVKTENEETTVNVDTYETTNSSKDIKKRFLEYYLYDIKDDPSSLKAYQDAEGKVYLVKSSKTKTVETTTYGDEARDEIKWEYSQDIFEINESSQLAKYTYYRRTKTNRDPDTKDWYSDIKITSSTLSVSEYAYGSRAIDSVDTLNNEVKDHVQFYSISGSAYTGNVTGTSRSKDDITINNQGESSTQGYVYIDKKAETSRTIEFSIHLSPYTGEAPNYSFDNVMLKFSAETATGIQNKETSNHYLNFEGKLPSELDDVIIKPYEVATETNAYYIINTSTKDVDLKIQLKLTASNYTIVSCEIE